MADVAYLAAETFAYWQRPAVMVCAALVVIGLAVWSEMR